MTQRHELRWGGFAGVAFVALAVVGALLPGLPPRASATTSELVSYVASGRTQLLISALLWAAAAGMIIWFAAAFAEAIREREERSDVHLAILSGTVLVGGAVFLSAVGTAAAAYGAGIRFPALTAVLYQSVLVLQAMIGFATVLPLAAAGVGVLRTHLMPDWLGYLGLVAAVISGVASLSIFVTTGTWTPGGSAISLVALGAGGIFVLCTSGFMVREHLPEVRPMAMPQT